LEKKKKQQTGQRTAAADLAESGEATGQVGESDSSPCEKARHRQREGADASPTKQSARPNKESKKAERKKSMQMKPKDGRSSLT